MAKGDDKSGNEAGGPTNRRVLIRPRLFAALGAYAKRRETDMYEEVNRAVREMLEREGLWPPKEGEPGAE